MKDIFNGHVKNIDHAIHTIANASIAMFLGGVVMIWSVLSFQIYFSHELRNILTGFGIFDIVLAIVHPILNIFFVRKSDRYPRIAKFIIRTEFLTWKNTSDRDNHL